MKKYLIAGAGALALCFLLVTLWFLRVLSNLPDVSVLKRYRPAAAAEVLARDGSLLTQYYDRKFRIWVPITGLPELVVHAVITAEDDTFFEHHGVNFKATRDALIHDARKRKYSRGGSTITQQMIKNVLLSKEKTISRKVREYVLARRAEELLSKRRILEIYLNEVEWGDNIYGIEAASRVYFDKHATELTPAEAALLAGMLPNPRYYNPHKRMNKARTRQERVLFNMQQAKLITREEYAAALRAPVNLRQEGPGRTNVSALGTGQGRPCYYQALERILVSAIGDRELYHSGKTVTTTLDKTLQDEFGALEGPSEKRATGSAGAIVVVKQGGQIRAIACNEDNEAVVRAKFDSKGATPEGFEVGTIDPDETTRAQIIMPPVSANQ